jgi:hypothetical protein
MKGKLSENTESFMVMLRMTQISVMAMKTTESFLRETNEYKMPAAKERQWE